MAKKGIDISAHQGNIDLGALKNQIDFVIIRVGYGVSGNIDSKFKRNADLCEQLGLPYGFYWYSYALNVSGAQTEADHFLNAIAPYHPTMGCWFDMEDADGYKKRNGMPSDDVLKDMCYAFCEKVENAGYYAGIYASRSWLKNQLAGDRLSRFDKWVAMWPTSNGKQRGLSVSPDEQTGWSMWQFTSAGEFDGYSGRLDTNYAYHDFSNPSQPTSPAPTPEPTPNPAPSGSTLDLVAGVMEGKYGDGDARKNALGSRYDEVQDFINHIHNASADALAHEVIDERKYGDNPIRRTVLGDKYNEIQDKINQILNKGGNSSPIKKGDRIRFTGTYSYSGMKLASWVHNDVFDVIEISSDRVVIGKGNAVTSAVNIKDCQKV